MSKKRFNAEQIVVVLRQIEVLMLQGRQRQSRVSAALQSLFGSPPKI